MPARISAPARLKEAHDTSAFDCGNDDLNNWLKLRALNADLSARTFVVAEGNTVVAYYCLSAGSVQREVMPSAKLRRNMPDQIPVVVIGRVGVDKRVQRQGYGKGLLKDAILRAIATSESIGVRAILIHALDDEGVSFYKRFGFLASKLDDRTLVLPLETAKAALE